MIRAAFHGLNLLVGALAVPAQQERAFVDVEASAAMVWLHEPCELRITIGWDEAWFAESALPLFQQPLDRPFHVTVPWLAGAEDRAVEVLAPAAGAATARVATGDRVQPWTAGQPRLVGGRTFATLELRCRWLPLAAGQSPIAPVELRFAFATRFEHDFLRGRQPLDREERSVSSPPRSLIVRELPAADRPAGFTGAVGEFEVTASGPAEPVEVGASFTLEVTVRGTGNLERMAPMPWPALEGCHVQGLVERSSPGERMFRFDVLALREGAPAPSAMFAAFSPRAGRYVEHVAGPVPVRVIARRSGAALPDRVRELIAADELAQRNAAAWPAWAWLVIAAALLAIGVGLVPLRRRLHRARLLRRDLEQVTVATMRADGTLLRAFETLCARRAGLAAFDAATVWPALAVAGVPEDAVAEAVRVHAALDAARFGGIGPDAAAIAAAAGRLVRSRRMR